MIESLGIYFQKAGVTAVLLRKKGLGKIEYHVSRFPFSPSEGRDRAFTALSHRVREFLLLSRVKTSEAWMVLPEDEILYKSVTLPEAARENLPDVLEYEFENYFPFRREDVLFDYLILEDAERTRPTLRVLLAVLKRERYDFYQELMERLELSAVCMEPPLSARISMVHWLHRKKRVTFPLLTVHAGDRFWEILYWKEANRLGFRKVPRRTPDETAGAFLSGPGKALLNGVAEEEVTILPLEALPPETSLPESLRVMAPEECFADWGLDPAEDTFHAAGAALRGVSRPTTPVLNLAAPEKQKKRSRGPLVLFVFLACTALLLGTACLTLPYLHAKKEMAALEKQYQALAPRIKELDGKRARLNRIRKQMEVLARVKRIQVLDILRQLTPLIPEDSWLNSLEVRNNVIQIRGYSKNASELIPLLENSPHFKDVEFISPVIKRQNLENFNITMKVED